MYAKILFLIAIFFSSICSYSQSLLSGKLVAQAGKKFNLNHNIFLYNNYNGEALATGTVGKDGDFRIFFDLKKEEELMLTVDGQFFYLWMIPGKHLEITEDGNGYLFSGQMGPENTFLYKAGIMQPNRQPTRISSATFKGVEETQYLDSVERVKWKLYRELLKGTNLSKKFANYCTGQIEYNTFFQKSQYPKTYLYIKKNLLPSEVPANYYAFWEKFRLLPDDCGSSIYRNSLQQYLEFIATNSGTINVFDEQYYQKYFKIMDSLLTLHPATLQWQKAEAIHFMIKYYNLPRLEVQLVEIFLRNYPESRFANYIKIEWEKKMTNSMKSVSFSLKDSGGKQINIEKYRGNIIYIDFWGSWCKPCMEQMPNSMKLQEKFKDKGIVFLFIDFFDTKEKWISAIRDNKLKGIHLKAELKDEDYFDNFFGIKNGFPRYALIDRKGRLVTSSAPHPNDETILEYFEKLLKAKIN